MGVSPEQQRLPDDSLTLTFPAPHSHCKQDYRAGRISKPWSLPSTSAFRIGLTEKCPQEASPDPPSPHPLRARMLLRTWGTTTRLSVTVGAGGGELEKHRGPYRWHAHVHFPGKKARPPVDAQGWDQERSGIEFTGPHPFLRAGTVADSVTVCPMPSHGARPAYRCSVNLRM